MPPLFDYNDEGSEPPQISTDSGANQYAIAFEQLTVKYDETDGFYRD